MSRCRLLTRLLEVLSCDETDDLRLKVVRVKDLETGLEVEGNITHMKLTDTQQCTIEFGKPVDRKGKPAKVQDGSVKITCSDEHATVEQDDTTNPFRATVKGVTPHGEGESAVIQIEADADLGDGVKTITGVEPLVVTDAEAVGFGPVTVSTPTEQP